MPRLKKWRHVVLKPRKYKKRKIEMAPTLSTDMDENSCYTETEIEPEMAPTLSTVSGEHTRYTEVKIEPEVVPTLSTNLGENMCYTEIKIEPEVAPTLSTYSCENTCYTGTKIKPEVEPTLSTDLDENTCYTEIRIESEVVMSNYEKLQLIVKDVITHPYLLDSNSENNCIQILETYPSDSKVSVKLNIVINDYFQAKIFVHGIEISRDHDIWTGLPPLYDNPDNISLLLSKLRKLAVCVANFDVEFQDIVPIGSVLHHSETSDILGYGEGDFGAICGSERYKSTIRSTKCELLVKSARCNHCSKVRNILRCRRNRKIEKENEKMSRKTLNFLTSKMKHCHMSREELILKIEQQKTAMNSLEKDVGRLRRICRREFVQSDFSRSQSLGMSDSTAAFNSRTESPCPVETI